MSRKVATLDLHVDRKVVKTKTEWGNFPGKIFEIEKHCLHMSGLYLNNVMYLERE